MNGQINVMGSDTAVNITQ